MLTYVRFHNSTRLGNVKHAVPSISDLCRTDGLQDDNAGDGVRGEAQHDFDRQDLPGVDGADSARAKLGDNQLRPP